MGRSEEILDIAQELIQVRGYNAFSFMDIAGRLDIKKASVQFYFPRKTDLGRTLVRRYTGSFKKMLEALDSRQTSPSNRLEAYVAPFLRMAGKEGKICLAGALSGEFATLPEEVQAEVIDYFALHENWLTFLLEAGREAGDFRFSGASAHLAQALFSSIQGAMLIARGRRDPDHVSRVFSVWLAQLTIG